MTVSTIATLTQEEKDALRAAIDVLNEILNYSDQYSNVYYSGVYYNHLSFDNLSGMKWMLKDLADAENLKLEL